jgi:hypothetical protein
VSGLEAVAFAGKLAAPIAASAAKSLGRRVTYRWKLERRVKKRSPFDYPRRQFRAWLKTIKVSDLEDPVEVGAARLAVSLDVWFCEHQAAWRSVPARGSRALHLVSALYVELLAVEGDVTRDQLSELWAARRNEDLVTALVVAGRGHLPVDDDDLSTWLRRRSAERRAERLLPFGLMVDDVADALGALAGRIPDVATGRVCVLIGPFGSGKSELAEEWHLGCIRELELGGGRPIPVWLDAQTLQGADVTRTVVEQVGEGAYRERGVAVVIDGLDLIPGAAGELIGRDARVFVAGDPRSKFVLTTRPGVLPPSEDDVFLPELTDDDARALVEGLAGRQHATWNWSSQLSRSVRRPFFALAAGSVIAAEGAPRGQVELLVKLVQRALAKGPTATGSREMYAAMEKAAVELTRSGGFSDGLSFQERQLVITTRLVVLSREGGPIRFALPIFEQWFAAEVLTKDDSVLADGLAGPEQFDRWRWVLAIALLGADVALCDQLMSAALNLNPGAGAWLIQQVASRQRAWGDDTGPDLDPIESRARMLVATRSWLNALGDLAPEVLPVHHHEDPFRLGVDVDGRRLEFSWADPGVADEVVSLPPGLHPFLPPPPGWQGFFSSNAGDGTLWPWVVLRDRVAQGTLNALENLGEIGPADGVWRQEYRYMAARNLTGIGTFRNPPISRAAVLAKVEVMLGSAMGDRRARFRVGRIAYTYDELEHFQSWLKSGVDDVESPLPVPDIDPPGASHITDMYSPTRMNEFCAEMLGQGLQAYDELADSLFGKFGWSLGKTAGGPLGAVGTVDFSRSDPFGPGLTYRVMPLDLIAEYLEPLAGFVVSANGRAAIHPDQAVWPGRSAAADREHRWEQLTSWLAARPAVGPFASSAYSENATVIECQHVRPASLFAAQAIYQDLKRLSLGTGTFPQLSRR